MREELRRFAALFAEGEYFDAHEELERAWMGAPRVERFFLQSLIHVAVAAHHRKLGNRAGEQKQLVKAVKKLAGYLPKRHGILTGELLTALHAWQQGGNPPAKIPRVPAEEPVQSR